MRITIELNDKLGEDIKKFCKLNNMTYTEHFASQFVNKYIIDRIKYQQAKKQFNLDRFGDLNLKIKKKSEQKPLGEIVETQTENEKASPEGCFSEKQAQEVALDPPSVEETNTEEKQNKTKRRQLKVK